MTYDEFAQFTQTVHDRAKRVSDSLIAEARRTAQEAGLDPSICFLHAHNAMCSYEYGHPWPNVDYSKVRRVQWLERRAWVPNEIASRITSRAMQKIEWSKR